MTNWTPDANGNGNGAATEEPVTVLLAAPAQTRVDAWYAALASDARFRVVSSATSSADFGNKLAMRAEVLVVDALLFRSAQELTLHLTRYSGAAFVLLPQQATPVEAAAVQNLPCVKAVFNGEVNLVAEAGRVYETGRALRAPSAALSHGTHGAWDNLVPNAGGGPTGIRIIAVWNQVGGSGKTTLSTNLAFEARRRGLKTLLIGLGAPDDAAAILPRTKAAPNIVNWMARPNGDGLKEALQSVDQLDVIAGFPDVLTAEQAAHTPAEAPESVRNLVLTAAYAGYAVILLDVPNTDIAAVALSAANVLLLVARPTLADALRSVEAYRAVTERLAGQHRIPPEGIRVALNQAHPTAWPPQAFHDACTTLLDRQRKKSFPPIVATIPFDPRVPAAQNERQVPLFTAQEFQRGLMPVAEACLQVRATPLATPNEPPAAKTMKLGPVRLKL